MSQKTVKVGPQYREATITGVRKTEGEGEGKPLEIEFSFSSENPVERGWWDRYLEVLDHTAETSIRMDRVKSGTAPLLFNHDFDQHIGLVESVRLTDKKLFAKVRFGTNDLAKSKQRDIEDGILKNVSFMYAVHSLKLEKDGKGKEMDVYRSYDWEPFEVSFVTVPADFTVGIGRGQQPYNSRHAEMQFECRIDGKEVNQAARSATTQGGVQMDPKELAELEAKNKQLEERALAAEKTAADNKANQERLLKFTGIARAQGVLDVGLEAFEKNYTDAQFGEALAKAVKERHGRKTDDVIENELDLSEKDKQRYSIVKLIRSLRDGNRDIAGLEWECSTQIGKRWNKEVSLEKVTRAAFIPHDIQKRMLPATQKRDLNIGSQTAGGFTVQNQYGSLIELLRNNSALLQHATMLAGLVGDLKIARQTGAGTAYWLGEGGDPTESNQTFGLITMTRKKLGAMTDITEELLSQSSLDVEQFVINDLSKVIALAMDLAIISGTGAAGQPLGILNHSGIGSVTTSGGLTHTESVEFLTDIINSNYPANGVRYFTNGTIMGTAMTTLKDSVAGAGYIWEGGIENGRINGLPAHYSTNIPASTMIACDPAAILVGKWGDLQIGVDLAANFPSGGVRVRLLDSMDVALRHVGAVSVATDI